MDLSIIIVSWNTRDLLAQCLTSIFAYPPECIFDVWVVDNASGDDSAKMVVKNFPHVQLIENSENMGFARANNQAINASRGEAVLLLNPDTEVHPGALDALLHFLQTHPEAGVVGPKTVNPDYSLQPSCYPAPTLAREFWRLLHLDALTPYGVYRMDTWNTSQPRAVDSVLGACLLVKRAALNEIGVLDENYFMYSEEIDLCYRIQRAGKKLFWVPDAVIVHYGGQSTQQVATKMFLQLYKSKLYFFRKHYGVIAVWLYKLILFFTALPRLLLFVGSGLKRPHQRQAWVKIATDYWHLIAALPAM